MPQRRRRAMQQKMAVASKTPVVSYIAIALSLVAIILISYSLLKGGGTKIVYVNRTVNKTVYISGPQAVNITSPLVTPLSYLPSNPPITASAPLGKTLDGINEPLNSTDLAVINNASESYFETAGEMLLNSEINNSVGASTNPVPAFVVNGKPSVIYLGSITCLWCGENRWAMALALSRFGNFSSLYQGYSSLGDEDLPTLYWAPDNYNTSSVVLGSFYSSKYINFLPIEETDPISGGFQLLAFSTVGQQINYTGNTAYEDALKFILQINNFQGTPYTVWGTTQVGGADAVDFGNSTPSNSTLPLTYMTHQEVFSQLSNPDDQFAWTEYAGADLYIAMMCGTLNNSAPVCSLSAIQELEAKGY